MSSNRKKVVFVFSIFIIGVIWLLFFSDQEAADKRKYFDSLNFKLTGIVKHITSANEHDYGVMYLQRVQNNKGPSYQCAYQNKYLFCKIENNECIIVSPLINHIRLNDSISLDSHKQQYRIYRKGVLVTDAHPWINNEDLFFYDPIKAKGYLDFSYYRKKLINNN
jgi:hypothetical protein